MHVGRGWITRMGIRTVCTWVIHGSWGRGGTNGRCPGAAGKAIGLIMELFWVGRHCNIEIAAREELSLCVEQTDPTRGKVLGTGKNSGGHCEYAAGGFRVVVRTS